MSLLLYNTLISNSLFPNWDEPRVSPTLTRDYTGTFDLCEIFECVHLRYTESGRSKQTNKQTNKQHTHRHAQCVNMQVTFVM